MSQNRLFSVPHIVFAVIAATLVAGAAAQKNQNSLPLHFTATATNIDPSIRVSMTQVDLNITRWSTAAEREKLLSLLVESGQDKVLSALQSLPRVGTIRTPDSLAYDLHYAGSNPQDDGSDQIVLLTDRNITFWELTRNARTLDYPFTVIELRLNSAGRGEGKIMLATKIYVDSKTKQIVLEDYATQPVRLSDVRREGH